MQHEELFTSLGQWEPSKVSTEAFYSYTFALYQVYGLIPLNHIMSKYPTNQFSLPSWSPQSQGLRLLYVFSISILLSVKVGGVVIVVDLTDFGFKHLR